MNNNEKSLQSTNINWYPGHMAKTKKQIIDPLFEGDDDLEVCE